jgi:hypothetical protein
MSISRFFSVGALGASLLVLAACGSPAGEPEVVAPTPPDNVRVPTTSPDRVATEATTTATGAGVPAYSPEVETGVYSDFRSYGFFNKKSGETGIIGLGDGAGDNEFTKLNRVTIMSTSGERAGGYTPFYLSWSFAGATNTPPSVDPIFFAPGVGAAGERYGKDVDGDTPQTGEYASPYAYLLANRAGSPVVRVDEVSDNPNEQDQAPKSGFGDAQNKRNNAYSLAASGGEYLTARVTRGTSTIGWNPVAPDDANQDNTIARYDVELIYPQLSAAGWKLQYSTFVLSRARFLSGNSYLVNVRGNPSVPATYGDFISVHSFTTTTPGTLDKDDLVPDGQSYGEARYKTTFAAWGQKKGDQATGSSSILYFLTGQGTLFATFTTEGSSTVRGSFDTWLRKVNGGPRTGTAETRERWRTVTFDATGTSGGNTFNPEFNGKATVADGTDGQAFSDVAYDETKDNLEGTFAGPRAEELVGTFTLTPTDPDSGPAFLGAFAGNRPANPAP